MSKRIILSLFLIALAVGAMLIERGILGGIVGSFFLIVMLFLWTSPTDTDDEEKKKNRRSGKQIAQAFLGIVLGLIGIAIAALILPPRAFPWVMLLAGTGMIAWVFLSQR